MLFFNWINSIYPTDEDVWLMKFVCEICLILARSSMVWKLNWTEMVGCYLVK